MDKCVLCLEEDSSDLVELRQKGADGINAAARQRGSREICAKPGDKVHVECRRDFTEKRRISQLRVSTADETVLLRSSDSSFDFRDHCLYCATGASFSEKHVHQRSSGHKLVDIQTIEFIGTLREEIHERNDAWAFEVLTRIGTVNDLPAAEAKYHIICRTNFHSGLGKPKCFQQLEQGEAPEKRGRTADEERERAFRSVMDALADSDDETTTINHLMKAMGERLGDERKAYGFTYMKERIKAEFGEDVTISQVDGTPNVVTFTSTSMRIISEYHRQRTRSEEDEKSNILKTAAKLLRSDIKKMDQNKDNYPDFTNMNYESLVDYMPESLKKFLDQLLPPNTPGMKIASIGHAIIQAVRPRALLTPLQVMLSVQLHHLYGSRFLVDVLNKLGFCASYSETLMCEKSCAVASGTNPIDPDDVTPNHSIQYMLDNADHNSRTLDGKGTFHAMGVMGAFTPGVRTSRVIPRIQVSDDDLRAVGTIPILQWSAKSDKLRDVLFAPLPSPREEIDPLDIAWRVSGKSDYSGMMQMVRTGEFPGKSSLIFLPMIDMDPNNTSCIYSSLHFVARHAASYNATPVVTFDQPLWWKALIIIESENPGSHLKHTVLKIGIFHLKMSFLGSIGMLMENSGLRQVMELVYADNVVQHIMSGKAVERAVRAHQLVNAALNSLLENKAIDLGLMDAEDIVAAREMLQDVMAGKVNEDDPTLFRTMLNYFQKTELAKAALEDHTSQLWLQYMNLWASYLDIHRAERTGDWLGHLSSLRRALPVLAATGHHLYTKTLYVYLQRMENLEISHPDVYNHFTNGFHVVRKSDRFWAGISGDLVIESTLMRALKTNGGLTRGRGFSEIQRTVWLLSRPILLEINDAMQRLTGTTFSTSEQHKESTPARQRRDANDTVIIKDFLERREPFGGQEQVNMLRNIVTGIVAQEEVNCFKAVQVGENIVNDMVGRSIVEHKFKKSEIVKNLNSNIIKCNNSEVNMDPCSLLQRFVVLGRDLEVRELMEYELCSYPASLFHNSRQMLEPDKPALADALWSMLPDPVKMDPETVDTSQFHHVVDGGWLLHRIQWDRGVTFDEICDRYINYVQANMPSTTVCFDGYRSPTTKDSTHAVRSKTCASTEVVVSGDTTLDLKKTDFLSNEKNKQAIIDLLSRKFQSAGIETIHADGDADVLIVNTAVESASARNTVLIGSDTDLLILLLAHRDMDTVEHRILYKPITQQKQKVSRIWDIHQCRRAIGSTVCNSLLFAHAVLGSDTTSRIFGVGKAAILPHLEMVQEETLLFNSAHSSKEDIVLAGERVLLRLLGAKHETSLDQLRVRKFNLKLKNGVFIHPKSLPPTSDAASHHSCRVYHQVQTWRGNQMDPTLWGWTVVGGKFVPRAMCNSAAPEALINLIRCGCSGDCTSRRCTCRKNGFECNPVCGCSGDCCNVSGDTD